jgi:hypothetical protein
VSLSGIIEPTDADFNEAVNLEVPDGFDSLQLLSARLDLEISNGFNFPGSLNLIINGNNGRQLILPPADIAVGDPNQPVTTALVFDDLAAFLNPVPTALTVTGAATFGDGVTAGTVTGADFIASNIRLSSPLEFIMVGQARFAADTTVEELDDDDIEIVRDHLIRADYSSNIVNSLPIGVNVRVYLDPNQHELNEYEADLIREFSVQPGDISTVSLSLDRNDLAVFTNRTIYITQDITLLASDVPVSLTADDSIVVQGQTEVIYRFDGDF